MNLVHANGFYLKYKIMDNVYIFLFLILYILEILCRGEKIEVKETALFTGSNYFYSIYSIQLFKSTSSTNENQHTEDRNSLRAKAAV